MSQLCDPCARRGACHGGLGEEGAGVPHLHGGHDAPGQDLAMQGVVRWGVVRCGVIWCDVIWYKKKDSS